ncbi:hypothetical protein GPECTOR_47g303 [Gonium pectorale]|uniref:F-box domain-containing protein n=1 Tax=Gonium pectorale TaxID=33097 RepID=A0A150G882_GONPE|nr:hypothetical protein GPECTOR_47g303 [Gonium pectorale]|eukprot:KXZ46028.1 hypothetical protein GPECTOR_47g303 [Gonium pectorale]
MMIPVRQECSKVNTPQLHQADLPPDVLPLIFPYLERGHRLDLRAVCRSWASWVDGPLLACAAHLNLVLDTAELRRALRVGPYLRPATIASGNGGGGSGGGGGGGGSCGAVGGNGLWGGAAGPGGPGWVKGLLADKGSEPGVLAVRFPTARVVRLWVGCRPPAAAAGRNGGGPAAAAASAARAAAAGGCRVDDQVTDAGPVGCFGGGGGAVGCFGGGGGAVGAYVYGAASSAMAAAAAGVSNSGAAVKSSLADAGYAALSTVILLLAPRHHRRLGLGWRRRSPHEIVAPDAGLQWHAHTEAAGGGTAPQGGGQGAVKLLRRLGWLAIWLVGRYAPDAPEPVLPPLPLCLPLLGGSERLTHLSLVSAYDFTAEDLRLLVAAFPSLRALALHAFQATGLDAAAVSVPSLEPLQPRQPATHEPPEASLPCPAAGEPPGQGQGQGASLPPACAVLVDASAAEDSMPSPLPPPPPPPLQLLPVQPAVALQSLTLSGVACEWAHGYGGTTGAACGLAGLSGLRCLVLHRALTQLTRLELSRIDYHRALPPEQHSAHASSSLAREEEMRAAAREVRRQQLAEAGTGPSFSRLLDTAAADGAAEDPDSEAEEVAAAADDYEARRPLLRFGPTDRADVACARADWRATLVALAQTVRPLAGLRELMCDVEPLEANGVRPPWSALLSSLAQLSALESLALPGLPLASPAQTRELAAALPGLTRLEVRSLPPPPAAADESGAWAPSTTAGGGRPEAGSAAGNGLRSATALRAYYMRRFLSPGAGEVAWLEADADAEAEAEAGTGALETAMTGGGGGHSASPSHSHTGSGTRWSGDRQSHRGFGGGGSGSGGGGDEGCLGGFRALRVLRLERASVEQLAQHALPLPPRLAELRTPLHFTDLRLLHARLLPALRPVPRLALAPAGPPGRGPRADADAPLLCLMLGVRLGAAVTELDLGCLTHPSASDPAAALQALRYVAATMPQLRRLTLVVTLGPTGLLQAPTTTAARPEPQGSARSPSSAAGPGTAPERDGAGGGPDPASGSGTGIGASLSGVFGALRLQAASMSREAAGSRSAGGGPGVGGGGSGSGSGVAAAGWRSAAGGGGAAAGRGGGSFSRGTDEAVAGELLQLLNTMTRLEELRVKTLVGARSNTALPRHVGNQGYAASRVPLGLVRALVRPVRVVDCSPLDCWCSPDGPGGPQADPRVALSQARVALAAAGCRAALVAEEEEWAAGAMGLGPEREAAWRHEGLLC